MPVNIRPPRRSRRRSEPNCATSTSVNRGAAVERVGAGERVARAAALAEQHRRDVRDETLGVAAFEHRADERAAAFDEHLHDSLASEQRDRLVEIDTALRAGRRPSPPSRRPRSTRRPRPRVPRSVVITSVGARERSNSGPSAGTRPRPSSSTRNGATGGAGVTPRTVSAGRSASAVPDPITIAWLSARNSCASARASAEVIHCDVPSAAAILPSRLVPSLATTYGRPVRRWNRYGVRTASRRPRPTPTSTSTPAARSRRMPAPATRTIGILDRDDDPAHAGFDERIRTRTGTARVRTRFERDDRGRTGGGRSRPRAVPRPRRARHPAAASRPPRPRRRRASRTHPTHGFGAVRRRAPDASCRARSIASSSRTRSSPSATSGTRETTTDTDASRARDGGGARGPLPSGL